MKYREVSKKLKQHGCELIEKKKGSHRIWYNPKTNMLASIPDHQNKDLKKGTLRECIKKLGLDPNNF